MQYELKKTNGLSDYQDTIQQMEAWVSLIKSGKKKSVLWFLEYPPLYTAGVGMKDYNIASDFPVYPTSRGGKITYHGPGQRVIYFLHHLSEAERDIKKYIYFLEAWIISVLRHFGVEGFRDKEGVGVWVETSQGKKKIAAIGVRLQGWVVSHGISFNIAPDLSHYQQIVPCGIPNYGVTSLRELGVASDMKDVDQAFLDNFLSTYRQIMGVNRCS